MATFADLEHTIVVGELHLAPNALTADARHHCVQRKAERVQLVVAFREDELA